eukprot:TRINITY_DN54479_c0_g1_i1.p1 TRINITY_DN54479_c0_g1~~TRINITY_DN54479_c0_g1_i1.p1  ORF type:complete len:127 (+),score=33.30 TRINITY_DN54479_c0_g1_i1:130-510(+)
MCIRDSEYSAPTPRPSSQNGGWRGNTHQHPHTPSGGSRSGGAGVQLVTPRGKQWTCLPSSPQQQQSSQHMLRHSAPTAVGRGGGGGGGPVSYTHLRAHETPEHLVCRLLLEKKKHKQLSTSSYASI